MKSANATDFPDWFGPMLVKELRQGLKARGFVFSFTGLQIILILVVIYHVVLYANTTGNFDPSSLGRIFWSLIGAQLLLLTPLRALNELASERKANTLELIFMSGLTAWRIIVGKWVSLLFQAFLFVLAVLPYAILRYYFGGVNLTEDLTVLSIMSLVCAGLTALALAISGLPALARLAAALVIGFVLLTGIPVLSSLSRFGRGGFFATVSLGPNDFYWALQLWDAVLLCLAALELGAGTVAPLAENHAGRQRGFVLCLWLPVPLLLLVHASLPLMSIQLMVFTIIATLLSWYHLAEKPAALRSYLRPFRGWRAMAGLPFQPGWPSAAVFLLLTVGLILLPIWLTPSFRIGWEWGAASIVMGAASLLCALAMRLVLYRRTKNPLAWQTLILLLSGVAFAILAAGKHFGMHFGKVHAFAAFPPLAIFAMQDFSYELRSLPQAGREWFTLSLIALGAYTLLLIYLARDYWRHYFRLCRDLARPPGASSTLPEAQPPTAAA